MKRYFIFLSYNGKAYCGWQRQPNGISVQQTIENALATLLQCETPIVGAGRTDAGVHALMMAAHFETAQPLDDPAQMVYRLNAILPPDIAIDRITAVTPDAHARFSALSRTYRYQLTNRKDPFRNGEAFFMPRLPDLQRMNDAAQALFDYRDFTSFSKLHTETKTNNCLIKQAEWRVENGMYVFTIEADRFLRNMVRAIVGTLIEIGRGKMQTDDMRRIIEAKDRCVAGPSVPAKGLFLSRIAYPEELFIHE